MQHLERVSFKNHSVTVRPAWDKISLAVLLIQFIRYFTFCKTCATCFHCAVSG